MKSQELLSALPAEVKHTDPDVVSAATGGYSVLNSSKGTLYRGRWGMWSWVAHRVTGIAIFFFLLVHVLDTAVVRISPEAYNSVLGLYKNPVMGLGETALVAAIVYHAFNGLRIIMMDFTGFGVAYQRQMWYAVLAITALATVYSFIRLLPRLLGGY